MTEAEEERAAIVGWLRKRVTACEYYRNGESHPATKRQWQADADIYKSMSDKIESGVHVS